MRICTLLIVSVIASSLSALPQTPREAVISAIGASIPSQRILLPIEPMSRTGTKWTVQSAHFDSSLRSWLVELRCAKPTRCVPMLATVDVNDRSLLAAHSTRPKMVVRAGESKRLVSSNAGIRISHPVTCLRSGRAGDKIPVRSRDSRRLFAIVGADGTLSPWSAQ